MKTEMIGAKSLPAGYSFKISNGVKNISEEVLNNATQAVNRVSEEMKGSKSGDLAGKLVKIGRKYNSEAVLSYDFNTGSPFYAIVQVPTDEVCVTVKKQPKTFLQKVATCLLDVKKSFVPSESNSSENIADAIRKCISKFDNK